MRKHKGQKQQKGLRVDVRNNNVEFALKKLKRMTKESGLVLELKKRDYYQKPSAEKRERKASQKIRYKYKEMKEDKNY